MPDLLAALDLGSNSFRLSTGRLVCRDGRLQVKTLSRLKETVRLASGLDDDGNLDEAAVNRAIQVLQTFADHLQDSAVHRVRAVATNTLRVANNLDIVLPQLEAALGYPIEIVSGIEEARLIFVGINHDLPQDGTTRLMVDIGGGSTEIILGRNEQPIHLDSFPMGCLSFTREFFADGSICADTMQRAVHAAGEQLASVAQAYRHTGWQQAYGSSGTAKGLLAVLHDTGMSPEGITRHGLLQLRDQLQHDGEVRLDKLPGLKPGRAHVLAGGLAIMLGIFQTLDITQAMLAGEGALRRGVIAEMGLTL